MAEATYQQQQLFTLNLQDTDKDAAEENTIPTADPKIFHDSIKMLWEIVQILNLY